MDKEEINKELAAAEIGVLACVEDVDEILNRMVDSRMVYVGKSISLTDVRDILKRIRSRLVGETV